MKNVFPHMFVITNNSIFNFGLGLKSIFNLAASLCLLCTTTPYGGSTNFVERLCTAPNVNLEHASLRPHLVLVRCSSMRF